MNVMKVLETQQTKYSRDRDRVFMTTKNEEKKKTGHTSAHITAVSVHSTTPTGAVALEGHHQHEEHQRAVQVAAYSALPFSAKIAVCVFPQLPCLILVPLRDDIKVGWALGFRSP